MYRTSVALYPRCTCRLSFSLASSKVVVSQMPLRHLIYTGTQLAQSPCNLECYLRPPIHSLSIFRLGYSLHVLVLFIIVTVDRLCRG